MDAAVAARCLNFGLLGHFMLSCADLRSGLRSLAHYLALISDAATFTLQAQGRDAWLVLGHVGNSLPVPRQRQEYGLLALLTLCRWLTRRDLRPLRVESAFAEPRDRAPYAAAFGAPLHFDAPESRLLLSGADLDSSLPSHDPGLCAHHKELMDDRLSRLGGNLTTPRVRDAIARQLHAGEPRRHAIAAELALGDHTLQRRLGAEGTSYQQVLDEVREELARKYLALPNCPLAVVSDRLGFADISNFYRACRRWFGCPPGDWRARHSAACMR